METLEERYFELFKMCNRIVEKMDFVSVSKAEFFLLVQIHRQVQVQEVSTVRTLAQDMGVSSPAVSRMIRSLSEKNMVEKRDLSSDRRNTSITLTEISGENLVIKGTRAMIVSSGSSFFIENIDKMVEDTEFAEKCSLFLEALTQAMEQTEKEE